MSDDPASPPVAGAGDARPDRPAPAADPSEALPEQQDRFGGPPPVSPSGAARPGLGVFTIEGRAAPGLFVVGWLATLLGFGIVVVGAIAPSALFLYFVGPVLLSIGLIAGCGNQAIERRARGEPYAGPSPYLVFVAMIAAVYAVAYPFGLTMRFVLGSTDVADYVVRLIGVALQATVFLGIVRLTVVGTGALSWREMGWRRPGATAVRDISIGAGLALPVIGLTSILAGVLVAIFRTVPEAPLPATGVAVGVVIQLIAGAVIAPIAEEGVFRGFATTAWVPAFGERGALIRSSLLFALAHVLTVSGTDLPQVGGLIVVGFATRLPVAFALGWLFLRRRSIWAPIGLHMTFNGILLILGEIAVRAGAAG